VLSTFAPCPEYNMPDYEANARPGDVLIVGGGGLIHRRIVSWIQAVSRKRPVFLWGVGINYADQAIPELKPLLERCMRVTLRHRENPDFQYSPCPSLGRPEFVEYAKAPTEPSSDVVFYSHKSHVISRESGIAGVPEIVNSRAALQEAGKNDLLSVLRFLGSGRVVVTNSYHGVLWSMAIDRPVVVWRPYSTRYVYQKPFLREPDAFVQKAGELKEAVARLLGHPLPADAGRFALLRDARDRVMKEAKTVIRMLPRIRFV
jgi:hypothetical protein